MKTKFRPLSVDFPEMAVPNTIFKVKPYIYGTKRDMHDPECEVKIKVDLWLTDGVPSGRPGWSRKKIKTDYIPRAEVDLEKGEITKNGETIQAVNIEAVIALLKDGIL
jgi:hypothetical protein